MAIAGRGRTRSKGSVAVRRSRLFRAYFGLLAAAKLLLPLSAVADDGVAASPTPPAAAAESASVQPCPRDEGNARYAWLRTAHRSLMGLSCGTGVWLDDLFGDAPNPDAGRQTYGLLDTSAAYSQFSHTDLRLRLSVHIPLHNLQNRLSAFFGRDDEKSFVQDTPEVQSLNQQFSRFQNNDEFLAGLGYALPSGERLQSSVRVGVRNIRKPRLFAQTRLFYAPYVDTRNLVYLRATPFWNSRDGFGITTGAEYNRFLSPSRLFRLSSEGTISEESVGFEWLVSGIVYQDLKQGRAIAPQVFVRGQTDAPVPLREYGVLVTYRQPLIDKNLYGRLVPGYSFPRDNPALRRKGSYSILLGFELPFGQHP